MLPFWAKVDLGAMAMKGCSAFPKSPASLEPPIRLFSVISRILIGCLTEVQSVYSAAAADWALEHEVAGDKNCNKCVWNGSRRFGKNKIGGIRNQ